MDVFITGSAVSNGGYIENNVFEQPWSSTGQLGGGLAFHFRNGGDPSPDPNNWDFRYNTFVGPLSISGENPVGSGGMRVIGNVFLAGLVRQGQHDLQLQRVRLGWMRHERITNSLSTYQSGFVSTADPGQLRPDVRQRPPGQGQPDSYPDPGPRRQRPHGNERHRRLRVHGRLVSR